jgi:hypothetical protein
LRAGSEPAKRQVRNAGVPGRFQCGKWEWLFDTNLQWL